MSLINKLDTTDVFAIGHRFMCNALDPAQSGAAAQQPAPSNLSLIHDFDTTDVFANGHHFQFDALNPAPPNLSQIGQECAGAGHLHAA